MGPYPVTSGKTPMTTINNSDKKQRPHTSSLLMILTVLLVKQFFGGLDLNQVGGDRPQREASELLRLDGA